MGRKKKEKPFKLKKKDVLFRLLDVPKTGRTGFYAREYSILAQLMEEFKDPKFWSLVSFSKKYPTLAFFSDKMRKDLRRKYNEFNYVVPELPTFSLGEKSGEDYNKEVKPQTIKDFLNAT